jgi:hypothetical protein
VITSGLTQLNVRAFDTRLLDVLETATVTFVGWVAVLAGKVVLTVVEFTRVVATDFPPNMITDEPSNPAPVT